MVSVIEIGSLTEIPANKNCVLVIYSKTNKDTRHEAHSWAHYRSR